MNWKNPAGGSVKVCAAVLFTGAIAWVSPAPAAVVENNSASSSSATYTVANDDLLQTSATLTTIAPNEGAFKKDGAPGVTVLTDGYYINSAYYVQSTATGGNTGGTSLIYSLDTSASPAGYTITNIDVYGGWADSGRNHLSFTVGYSTVSDPDTFTNLHTVDYQPSPNYLLSALSSDSGPLADNVAKVRFLFNTTENGYGGYSELDVIGTAAVPEPAALAMLGIASIGILQRRRRSV